ncbi:MAG: bifunctional diaminohydroxyphosphoribosylaminopyrimidine deaminase/5-amino-6-(5-phosphoribosylamino)uracil reductase RibD [Sphingobacteriia bacterium]|nr:MAG: bifunctional diaminohydroxyphosphoribosylaminopyrimidine deaminase/5-amino-6-(5-phosphoribosylamino)uracil reductase RibD [Sphingobacteriia bacterium]TAG30062.1 MAG: bifunctional diaminohydroxyphosphoribosylaminopyrimidine deaminase/5-amino-6-(5-phosphoribosylamino)uracil reductase RibD [Sphingobacteriia bacterium]TAH06269.1 MAG: bifunctional diaminohydroxyphosphoribosylaminopyrimidine deaminase/5-amino-6-(5-phosphoribosylamino)uracil reductase RibD [Sphingobacteriia bacterium]
MSRCIELAQKGAGKVAPNPMVGAILVHENKIIGEGYHQQYGAAHAEVNCINHVNEKDHSLIQESTLYISLEPCAHFGKTPPCSDLIIHHKIKKVVVGCRDPFISVNGKGIEKLNNAGVTVIENILCNECIALNKRFFTFHQQQRPYIILKWAQTSNGFIGNESAHRLHISSHQTNCMVHQWRSEEAAILIGTNTALKDNPQLTNRLYKGNSPLRLLLDLQLRLPKELILFNDMLPLVVFNFKKENLEGVVQYKKLSPEKPLLPQIMAIAHQMNIQSILVEGGAKLLQSFVDEGLWDEARVITNNQLKIETGISAPLLKNAIEAERFWVFTDRVIYYHKIKS